MSKQAKIQNYTVVKGEKEVKVTIPPSAYHACGGDGCRVCKFSGYEPTAKVL